VTRLKIPTACVIGWPVAHSRSPAIHRFWLKELGIEGDYVAMPVAPEGIDAYLREFPGSGYLGGNVTVPHKEAAFVAVSDMDAAARAIGAVNTLWIEDGKLVGGNTDALGFLANLDGSVDTWDKNPGAAVVLGAGGAARAVVTDIVYVPLETPLIAAARARGLRTADGLGMLLHQAAPGFARWFGRRPKVTPALRAAILKTFEA
jgi:shikimate dehydrogenase